MLCANEWRGQSERTAPPRARAREGKGKYGGAVLSDCGACMHTCVHMQVFNYSACPMQCPARSLYFIYAQTAHTDEEFEHGYKCVRVCLACASILASMAQTQYTETSHGCRVWANTNSPLPQPFSPPPPPPRYCTALHMMQWRPSIRERRSQQHHNR